jgi:hypothetical protein
MQVSGLQHPWYQHGFSTPGPRRIPVFWSAPRAIGVQGADALQSADEGGQSVGGRPRRATPQRVHRRYILPLTCDYLVVHDTDRACVARTGRTRTGRPGNAPTPGWPLSRRHGITGRAGHTRQRWRLCRVDEARCQLSRPWSGPAARHLTVAAEYEAPRRDLESGEIGHGDGVVPADLEALVVQSVTDAAVVAWAWSGLRSAARGQGATVSGSPGLMTLTGTSAARRRAASTKREGSLSLLRKILSPTAPLVKA